MNEFIRDHQTGNPALISWEGQPQYRIWIGGNAPIDSPTLLHARLDAMLALNRGKWPWRLVDSKEELWRCEVHPINLEATPERWRVWIPVILNEFGKPQSYEESSLRLSMKAAQDKLICTLKSLSLLMTGMPWEPYHAG